MTPEITPEEASRLARQCLGTSYDESIFRQFAANLLPDAEKLSEGHIAGKYIPESFQGHVVSYRRLAKTPDAGREKLDVLAVKLKNSGQLLNARSMQRQFIACYLNGARGGKLKDAALVAFHSDDSPDWRFSFVYKDRVWVDGKVKSVLSEPKRASFMVGPHELTHTAERQFVDLLQAPDKSTISRIREAFGVERVTREFFNEYRQLFLELWDIIQQNIDSDARIRKEFEVRGINAQIYAKRMLGQIVFLYFLQKKGWLGVGQKQKWGTGSHAFLKELFTANQEKDFFNDFLNPLFYDALATDRTSNDHFFALLGCRIPFLNGGLFEPLRGYDWRSLRLKVPNSFFEHLFEVFDRFNFTVREDEPLESEVAVDPEMLGKVFEGLLDVEERREKGTFYTPRHIVHYMCRESLAQYLDRALNLSPVYEENRNMLPGMPCKKIDLTLPGVKTKEKSILRWHRDDRVPLADIQAFVRQDEAFEDDGGRTKNKNRAAEYSAELSAELPETIKTYARSIDDALANVKICDPAIGSGAFAVGMMHEIVRARKALRDACPEAGLKNYTNYELKRNTIANSLYGVDLDPSAVDVAKLRLWLSLVVDENDYDQIKPLPNLDYKIMAGNSLDAVRSLKNRGNLLYHDACEQMEKLQKEFYDLTDHAQKNEKRRAIAAQREKCGDIGAFDWYIDFFNVAGKFDIVIGNPPYIQIQSMDEATKALKPQYKSFERTGDVYCLFYELGVTLLKWHGILTFITSNKWMRAAYGKALRNFFLESANTIKVIDFAGNKVFKSATVDVNIMILEKIKSFENKKSEQAISACTIKENCSNNMSDYIERNAVFTHFEVGESWAILSPIEQSIKKKIEAVGKPLKDWDVKIYRGILTGCNEAFIIDGAKKDELIKKDPKSAEIIRPILRGKDIKRYGYDFHDKWLILTHNGLKEKNIPPVDVTKYPAIKEHLDQFYPQLAKRQDKGGTPYNLRNCAYMEDFNKQKIVWKRVGSILRFGLDNNGYMCLDSTCFAIGKDLDYLVCFFNSNIGNYLLQKSPQTGTGDLLISVQDLEPILVYREYDSRLFKNIIKTNYNISKEIETKVNTELYKYYGLNDIEINYVEQKIIRIY